MAVVLIRLTNILISKFPQNASYQDISEEELKQNTDGVIRVHGEYYFINKHAFGLLVWLVDNKHTPVIIDEIDYGLLQELIDELTNMVKSIYPEIETLFSLRFDRAQPPLLLAGSIRTYLGQYSAAETYIIDHTVLNIYPMLAQENIIKLPSCEWIDLHQDITKNPFPRNFALGSSIRVNHLLLVIGVLSSVFMRRQNCVSNFYSNQYPLAGISNIDIYAACPRVLSAASTSTEELLFRGSTALSLQEHKIKMKEKRKRAKQAENKATLKRSNGRANIFERPSARPTRVAFSTEAAAVHPAPNHRAHRNNTAWGEDRSEEQKLKNPRCSIL